MESKLIQFSIVIPGNVHNPSLLNLDFLSIRKIVPEEWGWAVSEPTIVTPPLATVRYSSGVSITVEHDKLQIVDVGDYRDPNESKIVEIARRYIDTLPHIRYTAVGINFQSVIDFSSPEAFLIKRFLKDGAWNTPDHPLSALGLRLVYPLPDGRLVLSLDAGQAKGMENGGKVTKPVLITNANFHREWGKEYPADGKVRACLEHALPDFSKYTTLLADVIGVRKEDEAS